MVSLFAVLALAVQTDTTTYADEATEALIFQARQRHEYQDRLVQDYTALVRTRIDAGFGRSRFARIPPILAHETAARITWALPNDLKVDILGERAVSVFDEGEVDAAFDSPWFIPRSLGDSIRFVDDELPATAALHPLASDAAASYRYAIHDSVTLGSSWAYGAMRWVFALNPRVNSVRLWLRAICGWMPKPRRSYG